MAWINNHASDRDDRNIRNVQTDMIRAPALDTSGDWIASAQHDDFPHIGEKVISSDGIPGLITFAYADGSFDARYDFPSGEQVSIRYRPEDYQRMVSGVACSQHED